LKLSCFHKSYITADGPINKAWQPDESGATGGTE